MKASKTTSLPALSLVSIVVVVISGCSGGDTTPETVGQDFPEGTLSSSSEPTEATSPTGSTSGRGKSILLRVEGGKNTRFSGLCTVGDREYVISGAPSKTYSFEDRPLSCRVEKQDSGGGNLKVTLVSGDSTRSVQQTNAEGGIVDISRSDPQ